MKMKEYLQKHPRFVKGFVAAYVIFAGCFTFPFRSALFPLDFSKVYLVGSSYGVIALALAGIYGPGKSRFVYGQTLFLSGLGLLCRYFLEYGEVSNLYNFTSFNIFSFMGLSPLMTVWFYSLWVKYLTSAR